MTVRVSPKTRKRINAMKKELVTDRSYRDIHKKGFIYESPDGGKTIYRRPSSYCDVSGVKIDEGEQLHFNFKEDEVNERVEKMEDKISQVATLIGEITEEVKKLRDNN